MWNRPGSTLDDPARAVPVVPDVDGARRWIGSVRRVTMVEIDQRGAGRPRCRARGQGPRLPFSRPVPLSLALGLRALGVPLSVRGDGPFSPIAEEAGRTGGAR